MERAKFILLNEQALAQLSEIQRPIFILQWLRHVETVLSSISRVELKNFQKQLVEQLLQAIQNGPGSAARNIIARSMATLFIVGDTILLFDTVNKCNDLLKTKDDSPSSLAIKLAATACLGEMYEKLGRMMGRSYEETVQLLSKSFKNMESQSRIETMLTFEKICRGMDTAAASVHKEVYRIARICIIDRVMAVRTAAAKCIQEMMSSAPFLYTTELESLTSLCFRGLDGVDYDGRVAIASLLGCIISCTQNPPAAKGRGSMTSTATQKGTKAVSLQEGLGVLMTGFLRGATSFLKGEIIKGGSGVNREVRVGVTHAYVSFVEKMGSSWLEKNLDIFTNHILELVANPKAATSHVDAVYSRKCVNFILRRSFGRLLGEKAQFSALKVLAATVLKQMNSIDFSPENAKEINQETIFNQHLLVCALQEMAALFINLGTSMHHLVTDQGLGLLDGIFGVLIHPSQSTRLSAAWALRCLCVAIPSMSYKCIERCLQALDNMKASPEAVSGYSAALSAILGGVRHMPLGIPHATGKIVFNTAEELLRSASQSSRLSIQRSAAGWLMIGAIMTLGNSVVKSLLPRMLLLWRNSFPKTAKELESEKARGDVFTWQVTLEGRAGALSSIHSFLFHCPDLVNEEITTRLLVPIESALAMMTNLSATLKSYGQQLKASAALLRFRLYEALARINPTSFERSYTHMLRFVIWELTLNDNVANTTTSLFTRVCQSNAIFNSLVSDHIAIEDQLQPTGAAGSGAVEHDPCSLYRNLPDGVLVPVPLPLGVSVIDAAIELFGLLFPYISTKHRTQLIEHFVDCLKVTKYNRKEAVLVNIFCGVLCAMKNIRKLTSGVECSLGKKDGKGCDELKIISQQLVMPYIGHASSTIRCASSEVVGRIAQVVADSSFTLELTQYCSDKLKSSREVSSRTGHSLTLGCLHKYLGGMASSRHQHASVSILLNLAQDNSSPETQVWALHSLALIADTGGPLFRSYVEPSLQLVMKSITTVPLYSVDLRQATGKMMTALITGMGPELQVGGGADTDSMKKSFEIGCAIMTREEEHPLVQNEGITCFQRIHLFGGKINYDVVIPVLYRSIRSSNLLLRRSAIDCMRQFCQREADIVSRYVAKICQAEEECPFVECGISGALFAMLDIESDEILRKGVKDTLTNILISATADKQELQIVIALCKSILTCDMASTDTGLDEIGGEEDDEEFKVSEENNSVLNQGNASKWTTRVFAAECVRKIMITSPYIKNETGPELLKHLSDLIRMAFMGATSNSDQLRLEGLLNLETIVDNFAQLKDPDFPSASILEQFQAQVSAALRPAFSVETDPAVKSTACRVCSAWIVGNSQGGEDLRRVHTLMVSALENIRTKPTLPDFNESANTLEKLSILKAWALVFIAAIENGLSTGDSLSDMLRGDAKLKNHLLKLVHPEVETLAPLWLSALRDRALIELPPEFAPQLPREGGAFFVNEAKDVVRPYYKASWPPILHACAVCVTTLPDLKLNSSPGEDQSQKSDAKIERFFLVLGLSMEALCKAPFSETIEDVEIYMKSIWALLTSHWTRDVISRDRALTMELCYVLHRQLVSRCEIKIQILVVQVLKLVIEGMRENFNKIAHEAEDKNDANDENSENLEPGKSVVIAVLEVVFCLLMQKIPTLNSNATGFQVKSTGTIKENDALLEDTVKCLELLPDICSDIAAVDVQPTILYLSTYILGESVASDAACTSVLQFYRKIATHRLNSNPKWQKYLLCTLAKLLDMAKTAGEADCNYVQVLAAIGILIKESPSQLIKIPNVLYPSINLFQQVLESPKEIVRHKSVKIICELFEASDRCVSTPFIHALAPRILRFLYSEDAKSVCSHSQLEFILECIRSIQILVQIVETAEKRCFERGVQMLTLIVPVLINFLADPNIQLPQSSYKKVLHEICLQKLMKIGLQYRDEFRALMSQSLEMKGKLENAIKNSRANKVDENQKNAMTQNALPAPGTIKLKTDFSNFK
ncbi:HEAT repeat-containing protein 5B isoform X2 [Folsomia candida]|uniref:HEAT repeat-containing protein 5B n=1 Tax=Folsomia candida TaxID=158441 RepID=A0A226EPR7_FOLCA|nr:HEAT repeat-containing protein 5B isoform X2 [Folsomia candida]OXA59612.1 HEAT repeat-containing protein 5B [Folsomia candida]